MFRGSHAVPGPAGTGSTLMDTAGLRQSVSGPIDLKGGCGFESRSRLCCIRGNAKRNRDSPVDVEDSERPEAVSG